MSTVSYRSPDKVIAELLSLLKRGLIVEIVDPVFALHRRRTMEILQELAAAEFDGEITIETYAELIDEAIIDLLKRANLNNMGLGLQSISPAALKAMNRWLNREKFERVISMLLERDIPFYTDVIYGLPGSSYADFKESFDFLYRLGIFRIQTYRLLLLPGSQMATDAEKLEIRYNRWPPYEILCHPSYSHGEIMMSWKISCVHSLLKLRFPGNVDLPNMLRRYPSPFTVLERFVEYLEKHHRMDFLNPGSLKDLDMGEVFLDFIGE
jgi:radical SAM superfamily enzyme YgiQ (UPF0313 family)